MSLPLIRRRLGLDNCHTCTALHCTALHCTALHTILGQGWGAPSTHRPATWYHYIATNANMCRTRQQNTSVKKINVLNNVISTPPTYLADKFWLKTILNVKFQCWCKNLHIWLEQNTFLKELKPMNEWFNVPLFSVRIYTKPEFISCSQFPNPQMPRPPVTDRLQSLGIRDPSSPTDPILTMYYYFLISY
jgi:hypothetical protein